MVRSGPPIPSVIQVLRRGPGLSEAITLQLMELAPNVHLELGELRQTACRANKRPSTDRVDRKPER
jgi:hypothetical protein